MTLISKKQAVEAYGRKVEPLSHYGTGILNSATDHETDCLGVARAQHNADVKAVLAVIRKLLDQLQDGLDEPTLIRVLEALRAEL